MKIRHLWLAVALSLAGAAQAQSLPKPAEFYFDADANAARPIVVVRDTGDAAVAKLTRAIQRKPDAAAERAQLARIAMEGGRHAVGRQLYWTTLAQLDSNHSLWRAVLWNFGWDLYRSGAHEEALAQWQTLLTSRSTTASWMPPTLALVLWQLGRRDEAVQWYAAAVRTEPMQWNSTARFATLLPDWRPAERDTLAQVHAAWTQSLSR